METITTRIRALAAEMTASHTFGPAEVENAARELRSIAADIESATATPDEIPAPPPLDSVEEGAEPNPSTDETTDAAEPDPAAP